MAGFFLRKGLFLFTWNRKGAISESESLLGFLYDCLGTGNSILAVKLQICSKRRKKTIY